jgi:hypothetical protein
VYQKPAAESTLVIADRIHFDESRFSNGPLLGTTPRPSERRWARFRGGSLDYFFVQVSVFLHFDPPLDLTNLSILISEESVVPALPRLPATDIPILLTRAQFHRLQTRVASFGTSAFNSSQTPAIANLRDDSRSRFVLMDHIHKGPGPQFPFPDMRSLNPEIIEFIRLQFEQPPCQFCGTVHISGGFRRCCVAFACHTIIVTKSFLLSR